MKNTIVSILVGLACMAGSLFAQSPSSVVSTETAEITTVRETWRIQAEVPSNGNASVEVLRRDRRSVAGVDIGTKPAPTVTRSLATSATDTVTLADNTEITFAQLFEAFARFTAMWEAEDNAPVPEPDPTEDPE